MNTEMNTGMNKLTAHLHSVDEGYFEHMGQALSFALLLSLAALACLIHALLPFLCEKSGSGLVSKLHDRMVINRHKHKRAAPSVEAPITDQAHQV